MEITADSSVAVAKAKYFAPRRLGHVNLYVTDLDATMSFYTNVLGIEEVYRTPLSGGGFVSNGNTHHDVGFIEAYGPAGKPRSAKPGQLNHLAFELDSELGLVASYNKAVADGCTFRFTMDHDISHSVYGTDPEGNVYELYADVVKDWRNQRSGVITKPKPAWTPGSTPPVEVPCYHENPAIRRVEHALFHPQRTTHATVVVDDLETVLDYYTTVVGLTVLSRGADRQVAVCSGSCGEISLVLVQSSPSRQAGYHHVGLCISDPDDLDYSVRSAQSSGVPLEVDISDAGRHAVFIRDPDGFLVQMYADKGGGPHLDSLTADFALYLL